VGNREEKEMVVVTNKKPPYQPEENTLVIMWDVLDVVSSEPKGYIYGPEMRRRVATKSRILESQATRAIDICVSAGLLKKTRITFWNRMTVFRITEIGKKFIEISKKNNVIEAWRHVRNWTKNKS